ncbi:hypothetical protein CQ065_14155 [Pseudomonas sp. MYb187]|nr:hypothetical protein CQ065_14155 [Pseudomonas sp. MYb187]
MPQVTKQRHDHDVVPAFHLPPGRFRPGRGQAHRPTPLHPTPVKILELMRAVGAVALIAERRFSDALVPLMDDLPQIAHCISVGDSTALGSDYEALLARSAASEPHALGFIGAGTFSMCAGGHPPQSKSSAPTFYQAEAAAPPLLPPMAYLSLL